MYDPATNTWTTKTPMPMYQANFAIAAYKEDIYVIGGVNNLPTGIIQTYDPTTDNWTKKTDMPFAMGFLRAITINEEIYIMGGALYNWNNMSYSMYGTNNAYDPSNGTWQTLAPMPIPVFRFAMTAVGDKIYVMGGRMNIGYTTQTQIYDTRTNTWSVGEPVPVSTHYSIAVATTGVSSPIRIVYIGGAGEPWSTKTENPQGNGFTLTPSNNGPCPTQIYNPQTNTWTNGTSVLTPRDSNELLVNVNDTIYAIGGFDGISNIATNEQYFPINYQANSLTAQVPEFPTWIILLQLMMTAAVASLLIFRRHRKTTKIEQ